MNRPDLILPPIKLRAAEYWFHGNPLAEHKFIFLVLLISVAYAVFQLTPSSYALVLQAMGVHETGLVFGNARPVRSDEWATWTPYVQIAVKSEFHQFDTISPYGENLRNFNALPLWDWALLFKPQLWAFFVLPPAAAFSLMYAIMLSACLIGWYVVALKLDFDKAAAAVFSLTIFSLPYVQLWWTTTGPLISFLPLIILFHFSPLSIWIRIPALAWMMAVFLLSLLYVPVIASLGFVTALIIGAFRRDTLRLPRLAASAIAVAIGAGIVLAYLWEPLKVMSETVYPGHRNGVPGGIMENTFILAFLFPHFISNGWTAYYWNDLEIGTGGSYALLFSIIFVDYHRLIDVLLGKTPADNALRWTMFILAAGILAILAWWKLPLPPWVGIIFMWNAMPPQRLAFAAGLLAHALAFVLLLRVGAVANLLRLFTALLVIVAAAVLSKFVLFNGVAVTRPFDLVVAPLLIAAYIAAMNQLRRWGLLLLLCGAVSNAILFIPYNPVQRSGPIFAKHDVPFLTNLAAKQAAHPRHWLVDPSLPGATLVGLGFRSIRHVLITPQLTFFRERFPNMPVDQFNNVFNRYAHIIPDQNISMPTVLQADAILVPPSAFE